MLLGLIIGLGIGILMALLFVPEKGKKTRKKILEFIVK
jgi:gas vesicle protein